MIYSVVPFSRPEFFDNMVSCFMHQDCMDRKLIVVENGDAIGTCKKRGFVPNALLTSDKHQSAAKNEGIEWIRKHGGGLWTTWDDDDYYGPKYLSEIVENADKAEVIGKSDIYVRTIAGTLRSFENLGSDSLVSGVHGSTISARAEDCPLFKDTGTFGEDWQFILDYKNMGARCWATSKNNYFLRRHTNNTWPIGDDSYVRRLTFATEGKVLVKDYGQENRFSRQIVDGTRESARYKAIKPKGELQKEDSQAFMAIRDQLATDEDLAKFSESLTR